MPKVRSSYFDPSGLSHIRQSMPLLAAQRAGAEMYGSPRLNPFDILVLNEDSLSRIIADLFDPRGKHGQGSLFLDALCLIANLPAAGLGDIVRVKREVVTDQGRRIDLVVETPQAVIGIENKPWATQQPRQLSDYIESIRAQAGHRPHALVFISDQEEQSARGEVVRLPYYNEDAPSLHGLLKQQLTSIRSARARDFVSDFIEYVGKEFGGEQMVKNDLDPYIHAAETEFRIKGDTRKAMATVMLATEHLHRQILNDIGEYLLNLVRHEVKADFLTDAKYGLADYITEKWDPWPLHRPSWPENCTVSLEAQSSLARDIYIGVKAPDGNDKRVEEDACSARSKLEGLTGTIAGGRRSAWWPWYESADTKAWNAGFAARLVIEAPNGDISEHPEIQDLGRLVVELAQAVDKLLSKKAGPLSSAVTR